MCASHQTCVSSCSLGPPPDRLMCTLCVVQGMYALFVSSEEMYLCIDSYSSWITRSYSQLWPSLCFSGGMHADLGMQDFRETANFLLASVRNR